MKKYVWLLGIIMTATVSFSQNSLKILVKDNSNAPLSKVSVLVDKKGKQTNEDGFVLFSNLADGNYSIAISAVGYVPQNIFIALPDSSVHIILLQREIASLENVTVVSTTRNNQRIENSPLKVEVLGKEEMDEENAIRPASIASILADVSGIQILCRFKECQRSDPGIGRKIHADT